MDKIQLLQNAINFAKQNPDSPASVELRKRIESGMYRTELAQIKQSKNVANVPETPRTFMEKVAGFTGGEKIAQGLGQALANKEISKSIEDTQKSQFEIQGNLIKAIKDKTAMGQDTSRLENALKLLNEDISNVAGGAEKLMNQKELTTKQVVGDALQLGTTIASVGSYGKGFVAGGKEATLKNVLTNTGRQKVLPSVVKSATEGVGVVKGALQGAKTGAIAGGAYGASSGVSSALKEDKTLGEVALGGVIGGIGGVVTGGILGGVVGGVSGGLKGRALRKQILEGQIQTGEKTLAEITPIKQKTIDIAKQQGFEQTDIDFINSMKPQDKLKAQKMIDFAEKATVNKRAIERPIDVVGDSMVDRVKFIQKQNSISGKAVDTTAKELKGQLVNASPVRDRALTLLEDAGVTANKDGTPNWSKSIFNKTPELKNKIMKTLSDLPAGDIDAYDLHNFKKSIDEVVDYGVSGEGLKGKSASILKAIRNSADEVLDTNFASYNKANTDYKTTRELLDTADELFGKKVGIVKERGGQLLRSVFSNNTQRPRVMALVEQLDKTSRLYGGKFKDNLVDQALFTEILEDVYGTQATTSLQGQVARAIKGTQKVIEGIRNPIKGAGEVVAHLAEKSLGVSEENKRKILQSLLR